jgi:hypothetical protein
VSLSSLSCKLIHGVSVWSMSKEGVGGIKRRRELYRKRDNKRGFFVDRVDLFRLHGWVKMGVSTIGVVLYMLREVLPYA